MKNKQIIIMLFIMLIAIPIILTTLYQQTGLKIDTTLKGNFDEFQKPEYTVNSWFSGEYQNKYVEYCNNNFLPRGILITTYNQIRYSFFDEGNRIVGKDKSIFEKAYIDDALVLSDECNFSISENEIKMKQYIAQLEQISHKLDVLGGRNWLYILLLAKQYFKQVVFLKDILMRK